MHFILPPNGRRIRALDIIAQIGVILYMFLVGLELNAGLLRSRAHATVAISHASIVAPFLLGSDAGAVAVSATWPRPTCRSPASRCSWAWRCRSPRFPCWPASSPIAAWKTPSWASSRCQLRGDRRRHGLVPAGVRRGRGAMRKSAARCRRRCWPSVYIAIMLLVVRPLAVRFLGHDSDHPQRRMAVWVLVGLLFSALTAEWIGIHAIFGAFLLGAIIPHDSDVARDFSNKLEDIVKILLLPAFFAYTGMRTRDRPGQRLAGVDVLRA